MSIECLFFISWSFDVSPFFERVRLSCPLDIDEVSPGGNFIGVLVASIGFISVSESVVE